MAEKESLVASNSHIQESQKKNNLGEGILPQ